MKNILILTENARAVGRGITSGISRYARLRGDWELIVRPDALEKECAGVDEFLQRILTSQPPDAILTRDLPVPLAKKLIQTNIPYIEILSRSTTGQSPYVIRSNDIKISETAFRHFEERGYRNFAFCGLKKSFWSEARRHAFSELAKARTGIAPAIYGLSSMFLWEWSETERRNFFQWLEQLPRPVALLACNDEAARCVVDASRQLGIRIPEELSLLGVDNDELTCQLSPIPISSIALSFPKVGFEAARLIDQILSGENPPPQILSIHPSGVILRDSSDQLAVEDKQLVLALEFIRCHAPRTMIQSEDVARASHVSVRTLERKFKLQLGRTMKEEIRRYKTSLICDLLTNTNLSIKEIAYACGFETPKHISRYFSREMKRSPLAYRKEFQAKKSSSPHSSPQTE